MPGSGISIRLTNLDIIGYDLTAQISTPEPSTLVMAGAGALLLAGCRWSRRKLASTR